MYEELRQQCLEANLRLPEYGLVIDTFGNVSCADRASGVYAIKPSGMEYSRMKAADMVIVRIADGAVLDSEFRPSSDSPTHRELYLAFAHIGGIVHTHSTYATAWAQAHRDVPLYGTTHADSLSVAIPCADFLNEQQIQGDYEVETGRRIVECFRERKLNPDETPLSLVAGHGVFAWGKDAIQAVRNARIEEEICRMAYLTEQIRPGVAELPQALIVKHYERKHGVHAYYGQKNS